MLQANEALQVMLGYTEKEIVGTKVIEYAHPDFIQHWHELQENLWTKQIPSFQFETCLIRKDGSYFWCQVTSIIFRDQGTTLGYTIVEDINNRKQMEFKLKKLYDNQETMMHMVAHDLKSPLFNIKLLSDLLREKLEDLPMVEREKKEECFEVLNMIQDSYEETFAIIEDLLLIGELESSGEDLEETNLKAFIQSQLTTLGVNAQKKGISVSFLCPEESVYAHINQRKFSRVLINLFSNAVKFTYPGKQITISLKNKDHTALLQVSDTGIGIPEKLQANIFDKFTRANRVGTEGETTTGLGLYIVKHIVDLHQGKIWVESQENAGTTFFIELI